MMWLMLLACASFSLLDVCQAATIQEKVEVREQRDTGDGSRAYNPLLYEGFFNKSVWWLVHINGTEPICLATFISADVAITPCECVTKVRNPSDEVTFQNHTAWYTYEYKNQDPLIGGPLDVINPLDHALTAYFPRIPEAAVNHSIKEIKIHPKCGSLYTYNIATIAPTLKMDVKAAWVLTKSDVLFSNSFQRVIGSQAISGRCCAPYYSIKSGFHLARPEKVGYAYIEVQDWNGCRKMVCPDWDRRVSFESHNEFRVGVFDRTGHHRPEGPLPPYARQVCLDRVSFTKTCVHVIKFTNDSCVLKPGTPVYCEADDMNGFFGFLVSATFTCYKTGGPDNDLIFQGLNVAMDWLKDELQDRIKADEAYVTPRWISDLKKKELSERWQAVSSTRRTAFVAYSLVETLTRRLMKCFAT